MHEVALYLPYQQRNPASAYVVPPVLFCCVILALDLVGLAKGFALPHLPRMPELRGLDTSSFTSHPTTPRDIKFKDRAREKQRQLKVKRLEQGGTRWVVLVRIQVFSL